MFSGINKVNFCPRIFLKRLHLLLTLNNNKLIADKLLVVYPEGISYVKKNKDKRKISRQQKFLPDPNI